MLLAVEAVEQEATSKFSNLYIDMRNGLTITEGRKQPRMKCKEQILYQHHNGKDAEPKEE